MLVVLVVEVVLRMKIAPNSVISQVVYCLVVNLLNDEKGVDLMSDLDSALTVAAAMP